MNKNTANIRKTIKKKRQNLSAAEQHDCAIALCQQLKKEKSFINSKHIAAYIPLNGEISPLPLVELALTMGKTVYMPVLMPFLKNRLWFAPFTESSILKNNRYGIPEPAFNGKQLIPATHLDLVITPLVAFDTRCNRIGMGGGYYDRTFEFLRHRHHWISPRLIGIAYDFQKINTIHTHKRDVPVQIVITEQSRYIRK